MYVSGEHLAEAITELNACLILLEDQDFAKAAEAMDVDGDSAIHLLNVIAEERDEAALPYALMIGIIAARKAMNPTDGEAEEAD